MHIPVQFSAHINSLGAYGMVNGGHELYEGLQTGNTPQAVMGGAEALLGAVGAGASIGARAVMGREAKLFATEFNAAKVSNSELAALNARLDRIADAPFAPASAGAGKVWSIKERLNTAELPTSGRIRFVPQKGYEPTNPLPRGPGNGYIDRFGNEWVRGASRTAGQPFEWDVQLSRTGRQQIGWLTRDGSHANVSLDGHITHR